MIFTGEKAQWNNQSPAAIRGLFRGSVGCSKVPDDFLFIVFHGSGNAGDDRSRLLAGMLILGFLAIAVSSLLSFCHNGLNFLPRQTKHIIGRVGIHFIS